MLREYGIDPAVVNTLELLMRQWATVLTVDGRRISDPISIRSGIFQGDSLSPLLFITALNPISWRVSRLDGGVQLSPEKKINHLLYVDDWKLYLLSAASAERTSTEVQRLSAKAGLHLNAKKCAIAVISAGSLSKRSA